MMDTAQIENTEPTEMMNHIRKILKEELRSWEEAWEEYLLQKDEEYRQDFPLGSPPLDEDTQRIIKQLQLDIEVADDYNTILTAKAGLLPASWEEIVNNPSIPQRIKECVKLGLVWSHLKNNLKSFESELIHERGSSYSIDYPKFEEYLIKKYLPVSLGDPTRPVVFVWNGSQYVENRSIIERDIKRILSPFFSEKHIRNKITEITYRVGLETHIRRDPFNQMEDLIPVKNGVILLTNEGARPFTLLPHSPAFGFTYCLNTRYNYTAECPNIDRFIKSVVSCEEDVTILYEMIALCLLGNSYQKAYMLIGSGANGKSTFLTLVRKFLGEQNVATIPFQELCDSRFAQAELFGKLANICADIPKNPVKYTGIFKMLTGGDLLKAERKYKDPFSFINRAILIFSANELPLVKDTTDAFWRRWVLINFPNKFRENPHFINTLTTPQELEGLLNRVLDAIESIRTVGLTKTKTLDDIMKVWISQANPVWGFVKNCVVEDPKAITPKDELYEAYKQFCEIKNLHVVSKVQLANELQKHISCGSKIMRIGGETKRVWTRIRLKCGQECNLCRESEEIELVKFQCSPTCPYRTFEDSNKEVRVLEPDAVLEIPYDDAREFERKGWGRIVDE